MKKQEGQTIVIFALMAVVLVGLAGIALDQGLATADRRDIQAVADSASLAGSREYKLTNGSAAASHYVAMQYLANSLSITVPVGCTFTSCGNSFVLAASAWSGTITFTDQSGGRLDVAVQHNRTPMLAGVLGITRETVGTSAESRPPGPFTVFGGYAVFAAGGDFKIHGGGTNAQSGDVSGSIYADGNFAGGNNGPHAINVPTQPTDANGNVCAPTQTTHIDTVGANTGNFVWDQTLPGPSTGTSNTLSTPLVNPFQGFPAPTVNANSFTSAVSIGAISGGSWQPGTYQGFVPDHGSGHPTTLAPGVYYIKGVTGGVNLKGFTNKLAVADGTFNKVGAVAIMLDSTDTGTLDILGSDLNGLDDDISQTPRTDFEGTHNFVLYGPTFTGGLDVGSGNSGSSLSGIVDLPLSAATTSGTGDFKMFGSFVAKNFTLNGGGNGTQTFNYVCNLVAAAGPSAGGGLLK